MPGYIRASHQSPWIIQRDLDRSAACAPEFRSQLIQQLPPLLNLLITLRQTEAWFIADTQGIAEFLGVSTMSVPGDPEALADAKATLVALARRSRRKTLREDLVPSERSGRKTGPLYADRVAEFIRDHWSIDRAIAGGATSLGKLVERIERFKRHGHWQRAD
jgi:hypothetical protein